MALIKCPECDSQVSDKAQCCPNCGFPVKDMIEMERKATQESIRTKCKKVMGIALTIVVLCVVAIGVIAVIKRPDTSGLYNKIAWGSSEAQIKKEYPKGTDGKDDDKDNETYYLYNMKSYMEGVDALTHFSFKDGKLYQITFMPSPQDNSDIVDEEIPGKVKEYLCDLYGEYKKDGTTYKWETKKSDIEMFSYRSLVTVTYSEKGYDQQKDK